MQGEFILNMDEINKDFIATGGKRYFNRKDIPENGDILVRVLPPLKNLNSRFYLKRKSYWINSKLYLSAATFGEKDILAELRTQYLKHPDVSDEQKSLLNHPKKFQVTQDYVLPILLLDDDFNVIDDCSKSLDVTYTVIKEIKALLTNRLYQNGSPLGIFDREKGRDLLISKTVENRNGSKFTSYSVKPFDVREFDSKYLEMYDKDSDNGSYCYVDIYKREYDRLCTDEYLTAVMKNYLTGVAIPDSIQKFRKPRNYNNENSTTESLPALDDVPKTSLENEVKETPKITNKNLLDMMRQPDVNDSSDDKLPF